MLTWSLDCRSYKNGFVWQDLSENDFISPSNGHEYVLKGTQLLETSLSFRSYETTSTPSSKSSNETNNSNTDDSESPATIKGRSQSFNSLDYKLFKAKTCIEFSAGRAANASTQTEEKKGCKKIEGCEGNEGLKGRNLKAVKEMKGGLWHWLRRYQKPRDGE